MEMLRVVEVFFEFAEFGCDESRKESTNNCYGKCGNEGSNLHRALFSRGMAILNIFECRFQLQIVLETILSLVCADGTDYGGEDAWNAVEVVDAASIVQANFLLEPAAKLEEAKSRYNTSKGADGYGKTRLHNQVSRGAQHYTTCKGCIKDHLHV